MDFDVMADVRLILFPFTHSTCKSFTPVWYYFGLILYNLSLSFDAVDLYSTFGIPIYTNSSPSSLQKALPGYLGVLRNHGFTIFYLTLFQSILRRHTSIQFCIKKKLPNGYHFTRMLTKTGSKKWSLGILACCENKASLFLTLFYFNLF